MLRRVRPIARRTVAGRDGWLRDAMCRPDPVQGFGIYVLHEEHNHDLAVLIASWLPNRGTPPHDHGTWAVVAALIGTERNTMWRRVDDGTREGYADLRRSGERMLTCGGILAMRSGAVHSVHNDSDRISVSLHIYGRHVNHTQRSKFDPERRLAMPYKLATIDQGSVR
jgi:predicted metal-dependent enzyme (double-stranded beta helix superfamily)